MDRNGDWRLVRTVLSLAGVLGAALVLTGCSIGVSAGADVYARPTEKEIIRDEAPRRDPYMTHGGAAETAAHNAERPH